MLYWYEKACREAGMEEEKIKEMRRAYDMDYKRMKRENQKLEELGYGVFLISGMISETEDGYTKIYEIEDPEINVEEDAIRRYELQKLRALLDELPETDREFLLLYFEDQRGVERIVTEKYGLTEWQARYRRDKLLTQLRKQMGVKGKK